MKTEVPRRPPESVRPPVSTRAILTVPTPWALSARAVDGGKLASALSGSLIRGSVVVSLALVLHGVTIVTAIASSAWFRH